MPATFSSRVLRAPDVDAASIDDGDFLRFNAATGKIEGQPAGGAETDPVAGAALAMHEADTANPHAVTKTQVGLGNVDNTSDAGKPVSTAQQAALDALTPRIISAGNLGAAYALDLSDDFEVWLVGTLNANCVVTLDNIAAGASVELLLTQDGTGGRTLGISDGLVSQSVPVNSDAGGVCRIVIVSPDGTNLIVQSSEAAADISAARAFLAGRWYTPEASGADVTQALAQNQPMAVPFPVGVEQAFDQIGVEVTTAGASTTLGLGIYESGDDGQPGDRHLTAGTVDSTGTGVKTAGITTTLSPGLWWLALVRIGAAAVSVRAMNREGKYLAFGSLANNNSANARHTPDVPSLPLVWVTTDPVGTSGMVKIGLRAA